MLLVMTPTKRIRYGAADSMPCRRFNPMRCFPCGRPEVDPAARSKPVWLALQSLWPGAAGWSVGCRVGFLMAFWVGGCGSGLPVQAQSSPESSPEYASDLEFVRDIRPILERHCYACHAGEQSSSGLRLDVRQAAFAGGDLYGPSIVAGRSDESPLVQVVRDEEADLRMPPDGERLAPAEIARLVDWIDRGAEWPAAVDQSSLTDPSKHWSFRPLRRPAWPISHRRDWLRSPIDNFVLDALEAAELGPAPEVSRAGWLRRVTFDLIGLPPTPEELERFLADPTEDAYGRVVDRLLASPHHAERWAQHWFDVVRYADTHGFEVNTERPNAWPYRDYVIDALNRDVPYDQFVREQLHGDLLGEDAATGFLVTASVLLPGQIGQDEPSKRLARQDALDEIVVNIGQTFLGLSLGCARCHYHKFDPISQRDYFAIQALVAGVEYEERVLQQPDSGRQAERVTEQLDRLLEELAGYAPLATAVDREPAVRAGERPAVNAAYNIDRFRPQKVDRIRLTILRTNRLEPCIDELQVFDIDGRNVALASRGTTAVASGSTVTPDRHELHLIHDGRFGNSSSWMSDEDGEGWVELRFPEAVVVERVVWGRDRLGEYSDRTAVEYRLELALGERDWSVVADHTDRRPPLEPPVGDPIDSDPIDSDPLSERPDSPPHQLLRAYAEALVTYRGALAGGRPVFAGRFRTPDPIRLLRRGDPEQPGGLVEPAVPSALGDERLGVDSTDAERRRMLASWISRSDNPLTARVIVNRLWQWHFGTGLVETANDFGRHGTLPSHPELLDWLAAELIESGWSLRHLHRMIVLSSTYRQSTAMNSEAHLVDGDNRLLWRYPLRRLEGEAIRDALLASSGQLNRLRGGPGFDLFDRRGGLSGFEPIEDVTPAGARRMVYAHRVRRERDAVFGAFDCPDGGQSVDRRRQSTTPIQALNLMNSRWVLQVVEALAERLQQSWPESPESQVDSAYRVILSRPPREDELQDALPVVRRLGVAPLIRALFNSSEFVYLP